MNKGSTKKTVAEVREEFLDAASQLIGFALTANTPQGAESNIKAASIAFDAAVRPIAIDPPPDGGRLPQAPRPIDPPPDGG